MMDEASKKWYVDNNCDHAHCPHHCEHPQPFLLDGVMVCGRCFFIEKVVTPVEPCNPAICDDGS